MQDKRREIITAAAGKSALLSAPSLAIGKSDDRKSSSHIGKMVSACEKAADPPALSLDQFRKKQFMVP